MQFFIMPLILCACVVPDIRSFLPSLCRSVLSAQLWRRLSIWRTTLSAQRLECQFMWTASLGVTSQQNIRQRPSHLRHQEVVSIMEFEHPVQNLRPVHHSRNPQYLTRFEGPIGPRPRCSSSSRRNVLSGMFVITVINPLSRSLFMAPPHGNWCWRGA